MSGAVHLQCGLRIRSEFPLDLPRGDADEWDVDVSWGGDIDDSKDPPPGELVARFAEGPGSWYTATWTGVDYIFRFRECGEFVISGDLRRVRVRRDLAGNHTLLPVLVAGTLAAFILTLRGDTVLHASAVAVDGSGLAFAGFSGRGKSTMAALLCAGGAELVADDLLVIEPGTPPKCRGGAGELRLRPSAAGIPAGLDGSPIRITADDRSAVSPARFGGGSIQLSAIVLPSPSQEIDKLVVRRLAPPTALVGLLTAPRVHGWQRSEILSREFTVLGEVANSIPVYDVQVPWGPPFDSAIAPALVDLARSPVP